MATLGFAGLHWERLERPAAIAAAAIDIADIVSAVVEASKRGGLKADLAGGLVFSAAGVATALPALRRL